MKKHEKVHNFLKHYKYSDNALSKISYLHNRHLASKHEFLAPHPLCYKCLNLSRYLEFHFQLYILKYIWAPIIMTFLQISCLHLGHFTLQLVILTYCNVYKDLHHHPQGDICRLVHLPDCNYILRSLRNHHRDLKTV